MAKSITVHELFNTGEFVPFDIKQGPSPQVQNLWIDFTAAGEFYNANKESLTIYTVVGGDEGQDQVFKGFYLFNRLGYLFSKKHVHLPEDEGINYWS